MVNLDSTILTQLGIGTVFALLVIREFFLYMRTKREPSNIKLNEIIEICHWLKDAHDVKDSDGVFSWYVRRSLQDQVERLADSISTLNVAMHFFAPPHPHRLNTPCSVKPSSP